MVLEEATSGSEPEPTFTDSLPSSSPDLYAGDRNPTVLTTSDPSHVLVSPPGTPPVYVNLSTLPRRWGLLSQPAHPKVLVDAVQDSCRMASSMLGRPVRQEEADALAYHFARGIRIGSYGAPIGMSIAMLQAYRGYANGSYRFPGWTPNKEKFNPDRFAGVLTGPRARLMWQFARFNAYAFVGMIVGQVFFGSYAMTVGSVGRMQDPRLKELSDKIKERVKNGKDATLLPGGREYDQTPGGRQGETYDMARQRRSVQRQSRDAGAAVTDDASPTAGGSDSDDRWQESSPATGVMSDGYVKQRDSQARMEESRRDVEQSRSVGAPSSPSQQSGSAWDRLRQQAQSGGPGQAPTRTSRDTSSTGDSFMFSQAEEDQQLPRVEQQKQFDQRVEREREGKDFEGSQSGGGWRR